MPPWVENEDYYCFLGSINLLIVIRFSNSWWSVESNFFICAYSFFLINKQWKEPGKQSPEVQFLKRVITPLFFGVPCFLCSNNPMLPANQEYRTLNLCIVYKEMLHCEYIHIQAFTNAFSSGLFYPAEHDLWVVCLFVWFLHWAYHHWLLKVCSVLN